MAEGSGDAQSLHIEPSDLEALFDAVPNILFFVKDSQRRYTHANITIVQRLGLKSRSEVIGKRVEDVYPGGFSAAYVKQDQDVLAGNIVNNVLELQLFPNREPGWCISYKRPLFVNGSIRGLMGISRDLGQTVIQNATYGRMQLALNHLSKHFSENIKIATLAELTGFSVSKLQRAFRSVLQTSPQQLLQNVRVQMAMHYLQGDDSIANIANNCGFTDQSAFTRRFKQYVGMTPRDYRELLRRNPG